MAASLSSFDVATCVGRCRFATGVCETHCNGCMNVAWAMFWGGSRSTKPCVFPCKVAAAGDERYLGGGCGCGRFMRELFLLCVLQRDVVPVRSSMRFLKLWWQIALEWLRQGCLVLRLHA